MGLGATWVVARVGPHEARHRVTLVQRAAQVTFTCAVSPCFLRFRTPGELARLAVVQRDTFGTALAAGQRRGSVTYESRDLAVAAIASAGDDHVMVRGVANGSTWVIASLGAWRDSVRVETVIP
jgi:hypothetical protein